MARKPQVVLSLQCELSMTARSHPVPLLAEELAASGTSVRLLLSQQMDPKSPIREFIERPPKNLTIHQVPRWKEQIGNAFNRVAKGMRIAGHAIRQKKTFDQAHLSLMHSDEFFCPVSVWAQELEQISKRFRPDAVITYSASESSASLVAWCRSRNIPYWFGETSAGPGIEKTANRFYPYYKFKKLWKEMSGIVGHTKSMEADYRALNFNATYFHLPHWTRFSYSKPRPVWKPRDKPPFVVASLGRFDPFKGYDTLCKAVGSLRDKGLDVRVRLVGGNEKEIPDFRKNMGDTGWLEIRPYFYSEKELLEFFEGVDLFVIASQYEGPCIALLEAMAVGLPCVVSEVGGMPEILEDHRFMFPAGDTQKLATLLEDLLSNQSKRKAASEANFARYVQLAGLTRVRAKIAQLASLL